MVCSLVITIAPSFNWPLPTWQEIYAFTGLSRTAKVPQASDGATTRIHFIDVGQADATLIEQNGQFALIDTGTRESQEYLMAYLKAAGVKTLDYLIITHPHIDHIGGMQEMLDHMTVKQILISDVTLASIDETGAKERLNDILAQTEVPVCVVQEADTYLLGGGVLQVLSAGLAGIEMNNISPALLFTSGSLRFLCLGDTQAEVEKDLLARDINIAADLYKVSHHGSATSSTDAFVAAINPRFAVISCGEKNDYGHPHWRVLQTLEANNAEIYSTANCGTIVAYLNAENELMIATNDMTQQAA